MHSLNELVQEEEEEEEEGIQWGGGEDKSNQAGISRDAICGRKPSHRNSVRLFGRPALGSKRDQSSRRKRRKRREPRCRRMRPASSPLCVVSARITTVEEERRSGQLGDSGSPDERCTRVDGPFALAIEKQASGLRFAEDSL